MTVMNTDNSDNTSVNDVSSSTCPAGKSNSQPVKVPQYDWPSNYREYTQKVPIEYKPHIPPHFRSSLTYIVLENELTLKNKRRIVSLNANDLLYSSVTGKCVFIQINWEKEFNNIIKVHENNHTWETTFSELIDTRPVALKNLFARSEVWAEGHYRPLSG